MQDMMTIVQAFQPILVAINTLMATIWTMIAGVGCVLSAGGVWMFRNRDLGHRLISVGLTGMCTTTVVHILLRTLVPGGGQPDIFPLLTAITVFLTAGAAAAITRGHPPWHTGLWTAFIAGAVTTQAIAHSQFNPGGITEAMTMAALGVHTAAALTARTTGAGPLNLCSPGQTAGLTGMNLAAMTALIIIRTAHQG